MGEAKDKTAKDGKETKDAKQYIPEIIEAEDNEGNETWYFALIEEAKHKEYEKACDEGTVHIRQNGEGALSVCINEDKCGVVVDSGHGAPTEEQKQTFVKEHGVPVHHETPDLAVKTPGPAANDTGTTNDNNNSNRKPELKP